MIKRARAAPLTDQQDLQVVASEGGKGGGKGGGGEREGRGGGEREGRGGVEGRAAQCTPGESVQG